MEFSERLKELRKEKGMTQLDLASRLGVSGGTVAMWETGKRKPGYKVFIRLADIFDKSIDYIVGFSDVSMPLKPGSSETLVISKTLMSDRYEDLTRKLVLLDDAALDKVADLIRAEFKRCQEQGKLRNGRGWSVSVKYNKVDLSDEDDPDSDDSIRDDSSTE